MSATMNSASAPANLRLSQRSPPLARPRDTRQIRSRAAAFTSTVTTNSTSAT